MRSFLKFRFFGLILSACLLAVLSFSAWVLYDLPSLEELPAGLNQPSVKITDRSGRLLYEILPREGGRNAALSVENIPQCMKDATIAVEDKSFYQNPGVDFWGILRAIWINLRGGETLSGGSTITQQAARTLLLADEKSERTLRRKLRETILAWRLSQTYSKDEILALYLNQTYYGGMAYGVEAAAQTYFGKSASDLLLPECALLAGLPQAPGVYNPFVNPDLALERQRVALGLMEKNGLISPAQRSEAEQAPLSYNPVPYPIEAPHFIWMVKSQLDALFSSGELNPSESLVVRTTLDLDAQRLVEEIVRRRIEGFKPQPGEVNRNVNNAALTALNPQTGELLALVGSADYFNPSIHGALNMALALRQSGSAFKPIIYAAALDPLQPQPMTAATALLDVSRTFTAKDGQPYKPSNYDGREHGFVSVREALASSLNVPAVLTLQHVGVERAITLANRLGVRSLGAPQNYDLSLALGGGQMSLFELSQAYAAFANGGKYRDALLILEIRNADGVLLYQPKKTPAAQAMDPRVAWLISDILSDDRSRQTGFGLNSVLKIDRPAAVKTGTTSNFHDNWTIGYTPDLLVGVWVGNSDYQAMRDVTGLTGAAPIWAEAVRSILRGRPPKEFERPDNLVQVEVCSLSGLLPTAACQRTRMEWFIAGTQPATFDSFYRFSDSGELVLDLPVEARDWARANGFPLLEDSNLSGGLTLTSPPDNATYRIAPDLGLASQQVALSARSGSDFAQVAFFVDGAALGAISTPPYQIWWTLSPGRHQIWAEGTDAAGGTVKSNIVHVTVEGEASP
ncbi:MAG: penicillin-binding protein 1C [Chloroflexi bacterium]|nr:penicillin-binding protein 1C [Chloroflexota bacterium]MCA2002167.1 penicillin-binding protein 1C [Chloroflexota bacterium]